VDSEAKFTSFWKERLHQGVPVIPPEYFEMMEKEIRLEVATGEPHKDAELFPWEKMKATIMRPKTEEDED
jgi:hypothetical protein